MNTLFHLPSESLYMIEI